MTQDATYAVRRRVLRDQRDQLRTDLELDMTQSRFVALADGAHPTWTELNDIARATGLPYPSIIENTTPLAAAA